MHFRMFAFIGLAGLLIASPEAVAAGVGGCGEKTACCEKAHKASCVMPCCKDQGTAIDQPTVATMAPARQAVSVWFHRPVQVGDRVLQGRYVIEHDNDRMARGEPCTHIYAFNNQRLPVVAFHCTHLERDAAKAHRVVLASTGEVRQKFIEFQFAGETGAHGVPTVR